MDRLTFLVLSCLLASAFAVDESSSGKSSLSSIIPSAGAVELLNGNGDVSASGACKSVVKQYCKSTKSGDGRLASCLYTKIRDSKKGNAGKKIGEKCVEEVAAFKIDRASHINKDTTLARACKDQVEKLCKSSSDEKQPGSVIACLKDKRKKLAGACKAEVFRVQKEAAEDYRTDYKLYQGCKDDRRGSNGEIDCLIQKRIQRVGDDIRLVSRLFTKCYSDFTKFCKDVEPGHMQVQECLEDNMEDDDFSLDCKDELDNTIAKRVSDFRLDEALREACEEDLSDLCGATLETMDDDAKVHKTALSCLQQYRGLGQDPLNCLQHTGRRSIPPVSRNEIHPLMTRASKDIRFDEVLADACYTDREQYCNDVSPGSARVIRCLQDHRNSLEQKCAAALFDHEVKMAEDIDFK
eukprot:gene10076-7973_t